MRFRLSIVAVVTTMALTQMGLAGQARVGEPAPSFELRDSDGTLRQLSDYKGTILVLHFQSCICPWDAAYQPILSALAKQFRQTNTDGSRRVKFLAINVNWSENTDQIRRYISQTGTPYPILKDNGRSVADIYGATTTPHVFVIHNDEEQTLVYKGGIEQAPLSPPHCGESREQYLEPVLQALLDGTAPHVNETQNVGCPIKREYTQDEDD